MIDRICFLSRGTNRLLTRKSGVIDAIAKHKRMNVKINAGTPSLVAAFANW